MQRAPAAILNQVVKHFLILENEEAILRHHRLSPDGHAGIVFYYREPFSTTAPLPVVHPRSFVYGQISRFHDLSSGGRTGMLVVVLQPYGLHLLTGIPAHELTDQLISGPLIFGKEGLQLEEQIVLAADTGHRVQLIESFLVNKLQVSPVADPVLQQAVHQIYAHNGLLQVAQLTNILQLTERRLERKFRDNIGLSPKQFLRTIRFQYLLKLLQQAPDDSLTRLAYNAGYYDQSHFIHEFRLLAGITPGQYITQTRLLAINFMQFVR